MRASKEARIHKAWREQVARLIEDAGAVRCDECEDGGHEAGGLCLLDGARFDVAHVRSYAERLIAEGERLELERVTFMDWTRTQPGPVPEGLSMSQGMGPENREPGAFDDGSGIRGGFFDVAPRGGWPGPLAREWGTVRCEACEGKGLAWTPHAGQPVADRRFRFKGDQMDVLRRCKPCKGRGYVKRHGREPAAANGGDWMIRAGRRLLDTLDGRCPWAPSAAAQPSECQRCHGDGHTTLTVGLFGSLTPDPCPRCRGTGRNLSGTLPPVEHCMRTVVRARDGDIAAERLSGTQTAQWQADVLASADPGPFEAWVRMSRPPTRVVPRGEHRQTTDNPGGRGWSSRGTYEQTPWLGAESQRKVIDAVMTRLPRWRRGELRHSEQRRERERRREGQQVIGWAREVRADGSVVADLDL